MTLLSELDAFFTDHRQCGNVEAGVEGRGGRDVAGAASAGLRAAWIRRSAAEPPEKLGYGPERIVHALIDLPPLLEAS
jgi:hypothetical protein